MEYEIFNIFKNYTSEAFIIALGAFLLTYIIKFPIKKLTAQLNDDKRKMANIVIMFIPLIITTVASIVYYGLTQQQWVSLIVWDCAVSSWVISLSIYAIFSRIILVLKGIGSGKLKINSELTKQTVSYFKDTVKALNKENKTAEKSILTITKKLESLTEIRNLLLEDNSNLNLSKIADLNSQINELQTAEKENQTKITDNQNLINNYNDKLYVKPNKNK